MKGLFLAYIALFTLVGCMAQQAPAPATGAALAPASYAAGSTANTTAAFDGTYSFESVRNVTQGSALPAGGEGVTACPNYTASPLVISNGLAQFDVLNIRFQGYVTPQGSLAMRTGVGQRFEGQVNPQGVITGRVIGACAYEGTWRKSA
jgi:hypothetical protein